jgi:hypothetical protein
MLTVNSATKNLLVPFVSWSKKLRNAQIRCFTEFTLSFAEGFNMTQQQMPNAFCRFALAREIQLWFAT